MMDIRILAQMSDDAATIQPKRLRRRMSLMDINLSE
jgi:hypothetical protein